MPCSLRRRACCEPGTDSMVCAIQGCLPRSLDEFIHLLGHCGRQRRLFECEVSSSPLLRFGRLASGCGCVCCRLGGGRGPKAQGSRRQARARRRFCGLSASLRVAARTPLDNHLLTAEALAVVVFIVTSVFNSRAVCNNNRCVETGQSSPSGVVLMGWGRECSDFRPKKQQKCIENPQALIKP